MPCSVLIVAVGVESVPLTIKVCPVQVNDYSLTLPLKRRAPLFYNKILSKTMFDDTCPEGLPCPLAMKVLLAIVGPWIVP